jgi:hypothetical protein
LNDKTVIRAVAGISADPQNLLNARNTYLAQIALNENAANSYTVATSFTTGISPITIPNINAGQMPLPENIATYVFPLRIRRGYIESYNLAAERTLPGSFVAEVAYVGTHALRQQP